MKEDRAHTHRVALRTRQSFSFWGPILSRASLVAQMVKNPPAMRETWVGSLGWQDPLEKGKATHSSILAWKSPLGRKESDMTE